VLIRELELKNVKSYSFEKIEFLEGVNGIIGSNGSGKSTILEAIGYALFNFLPYKKKDFLRRGTKSGKVILRVVGDNGARYEIERGVGALSTYTLSCPSKQIEVSGVKDVLHVIENDLLASIPDQQLSPMFEHLIGVPQGSFFSVFLLSASQRKEQFNRILRMDEYDRAFENMRDVERRVENEIDNLEQRTAELETLTKEYPELKEQGEMLKRKLADYSTERDEKKAQLERAVQWLEELEQVVEEQRRLREKKQLTHTRTNEKKAQLEDVQKELTIARKALSRMEALEPLYTEHGQVKKDIEVLDARDRRRVELERLKEGNDARASELARQLEKREVLKGAVEQLKKSCDELRGVGERYNTLGLLKDELTKLSHEHDVLTERIDELKTRIDELTALTDEIERLEHSLLLLAELERKERALDEELAGRRAVLTQLEKEKGKLKEQMRSSGRGRQCPILKDTECPVVESFEDYFREKLEEAESRLEEEQVRILSLSDEIRELGEPRRRAAQLEGELKEKRRQTAKQELLEKESTSAKARLSEVEKAIAVAAKRVNMPLFASDVSCLIEHLKGDMEKLEKDVSALNRYELELSSKSAELSELDGLEVRLDSLKEQTDRIEAELKALEGVSEELALKKRRLGELEQPYREYIAAKSDAKRHKELSERKMQLEMEVQALLSKCEQLEGEYEELVEHYSDEEHLEATKTLESTQELCLELEKKVTQLQTQHSEVERRTAELEEKLEQLSQIEGEVLKLKAMHELVVFMRDVLKRAAPLVISRVVRDVSEEANEIYCEAMGTYTQQLRWSDDEQSLYDVELKEKAEVRSFRQLSGGEQMCASIAVRLALLKLLLDSDVVFLDEPTANLDEERRENLSDKVLNIKGFEQLFVITHDDSFSDKYDHTVHLKKVGGESTVASPFD